MSKVYDLVRQPSYVICYCFGIQMCPMRASEFMEYMLSFPPLSVVRKHTWHWRSSNIFYYV